MLGAIGAVVTMLVEHEQLAQLIRGALTRSGEPFTENDVVNLIGPFRIGGGLVVAVVSGLILLVAFKMRAGRNWARVLLTLFTLLDMVNFLGAVSESGVALDFIWSLAGVAFAVAAVIYLFRPESMTFFAESKKRR